MSLSIMRDRLERNRMTARKLEIIEDGVVPFVSPYLERPLRSLEQARRDIERKERIDDRS